MTSQTYPSVRFTEQDLEMFSAASGDRNPLHLSEEYAARTSYGQRVVFGALGAVACLGQIAPPEGTYAACVTGEFLRPIFLGVDYGFRSREQAGARRVEMLDGSVPVVALTVKYVPEEVPAEDGAEAGPLFERTKARVLEESEIMAGLTVTGRHRCDGKALEALCRRWGICANLAAVRALLWSSYLIGMELPGERALFSKIRMEMGAPALERGPLEYTATVRSFNKWKQLETEFSLRDGDRLVASGECLAYPRPALPEVDILQLKSLLPESGTLKDKVGLVIGGSRGLGAAITAALALQGARVVVVSRSASKDIASGDDLGGAIFSEQGDVADSEWLQRLRERILARHGRLDFLVCNAFPAPQPMRLEPNTAQRIEDYVQHAVSLVSRPLCAFLDLLNHSGGYAVVISSEAIEKPVKEWPQYIAAKHAVEGLAQVAALQYPRTGAIIVRPPKLLTEMMNTPLGRRNALAVEKMAARIIKRMADKPEAGGVEVLRY